MTDSQRRKIEIRDTLSVPGEARMGVVLKQCDPFIDGVVTIETIKLDSVFAADNRPARLQMEARS